jgi:hypothetical protein
MSIISGLPAPARVKLENSSYLLPPSVSSTHPTAQPPVGKQLLVSGFAIKHYVSKWVQSEHAI